MILKDMFRFVVHNMKKNKSRVFMTVLATAMGCAFLIVLASVGFGLHKSIIDQVTSGRLLTEISLYDKMVDDQWHQLTDEDIEWISTLDNVKTVTKRQSVGQWPVYYIDNYFGESRTVVVHWPSELEAGLTLHEGRLPEKDNEVVVGYHFRNILREANPVTETTDEEVDNNTDEHNESEPIYEGDYDDVSQTPAYDGELLNETIQMEVRQMVDGEEQTKLIELTIVGFTEPPTREWFQDQSVYISEQVLADIEAFTGTPKGAYIHDERDLDYMENIDLSQTTYDEVKVYVNSVENVSTVAQALRDEGYWNHSIVDEMKEIDVIFNIMKIGLIFVGTIAVLIASIGIYNTMTMAVTERYQDIGIMKAIGANPKTIKRIFLIESAFIGLMGTLIGAVIAYGISFIVNIAIPLILEMFLDQSPPEGFMFSYIPVSLTLIAATISVGVALLSGWLPARKATQVDVLNALRRDV